MVSSDDLNGAARFVNILQAAIALQAHKGIEDVFCEIWKIFEYNYLEEHLWTTASRNSLLSQCQRLTM